MPDRNKVPSLKLITMRKVAWPDGVQRTEENFYPSAEQYCRDTIYRLYLQQNVSQLKKWVGTDTIKNISNAIVNSWIQISNYYESSLADFKHMEPILKCMHPVETLDFLHEGLTLSEEPDKFKLLPFIGVIPRTINPQPVNAANWNIIVETLIETDVIRSVKELFIKFGDEYEENFTKSDHGPSISYQFTKTFERFHNLTKLVVRGVADDTFLQAVGVNCYRLKYLDISQSDVTDVGIRLLFYKRPEMEMRYHTAYVMSFFWNLPKYLLRPLTKTMEYFEMSDLPKLDESIHVESTIIMACPQLIATPNRLFFSPRGKIKIVCKEFNTSPTLVALRQHLVLHVRSKFCEDIFCFVRGLLACTYVSSPTFQVRVDEGGHEIGFLLFSTDLLIAYCELENLTVVNFTSYTKSSCEFIPLELLGHLAPNLQRIKASLKGTVSEKYPLKQLKHVTAPILYNLDTLKSIVQQCKRLQYLEIREILSNLSPLNDFDIEDIFQETAECLEVFRLIFRNNISMINGLTCIVTNCPAIRIIGDLKYWSMSEKSCTMLQAQLGLHNFSVAIEYNELIYFSDNSCKEIRHPP